MRRAQPWRINRARSLRSSSTAAEDRLWSHLRNRQLAGVKFVRQAPVGPYFVDFLCRKLKIIIEIDGATHSTAPEMSRDAARSSYLEAEGYRIFRAHNSEVAENIDGVLETLLAFIETKMI